MATAQISECSQTTQIDRISERQSNFELLRIVAMFLVLIVHADFFSLGAPSHEDLILHPISSLMRYVIQSLSLVCVNVYIIISGYFKIKVKTKSILNFIFMIVFWRLAITFIFLIASYLNLRTFNISYYEFFKLCIPGYKDWFVGAYILLLFIAPMLNDYMAKRSAKQLWVFLSLYLGLQILFAWFIPIYTQFGNGYTVLSFIGLYILGGVIRKTGVNLIRHPFILYILTSVSIGIIVFLFSRFCNNIALNIKISYLFSCYNGLFVLLASMLLFLGFGKLSLKSRLINQIAASSFAVYLFHMHPLMQNIYSAICKYLFVNYNTLPYLCMITGFIICVFITSICIDYIRRWIWEKTCTYFRYA